MADPADNKVTFCYYTEACAHDVPSGGGQSTDLYAATDPGSLTTTYTYDASNSNTELQRDLLMVTPPGAGEIENTYNTSGRVTRKGRTMQAVKSPSSPTAETPHPSMVGRPR